MKNRNQLCITCGAVGVATMAWAGAIATNFANADVIDTITVTVGASCSMVGVVDPDSAHTDKISGGTVKDDIGRTSFKATCNDTNGFAIYAVGNTGGRSGSTVLAAESPLTSSSDIATGTAVSGDTSNWAMKLTAGDDDVAVESEFDDYTVVPATNTKVAAKTSGLSSGDAVAITSTYRAFISTSQPAGSYIGQVKYTLINPSTATPK